MKGYLERLVRVAANPAESVRPWTASVFARYQGDFQVDPSGESASPTPAVRSREENPDSAQAHISDSKQTSLPHLERSSTISGSPPTEIALGGPGSGQNLNRGPSLTKGVMPPPPIVHAVRSTHAAEVTRPEPGAKGSPSDLAHRAYDPLVAKPGRAKMEFPIGSSLPPPAGEKGPPATQSSTAADRQAAEEIQIHIGRIEVMAVRPQAPRTPKTSEKEISLDAYLNRRGGRAG
jgi:hypothetical protein